MWLMFWSLGCHQWHLGSLCTFIVQASWDRRQNLEADRFYSKDGLEKAILLEDRVHLVHMIVLVKRWSWKGHSSLTLGKPMYVHFSGFPGNRSFEQIVLFGGWSWKVHSPGRQSSLSEYKSFIPRWSWNDRLFGYDVRGQRLSTSTIEIFQGRGLHIGSLEKDLF